MLSALRMEIFNRINASLIPGKKSIDERTNSTISAYKIEFMEYSNYFRVSSIRVCFYLGRLTNSATIFDDPGHISHIRYSQ
jgi:hypothetical protein